MNVQVGSAVETGAAAGVLRVGGCRLDIDRGVLTAADGTETALRPKTLGLALLLLANPGRVVSRAEILDSIWPGVFVSDDSVTQCVTELRRAMGAEGAVLLKTLPRRGYLLDGDVVAASPTASPPVAPRLAPAASPTAPPAAARRWAPFGAAGLAGAALLAWLAWPATPPPAVPPAPTPPVAATPPVVATPPAPAEPTARERAIELIELARRRNIAPGDRRANWIAARDLLAQALALDPDNPRAHAEMVFTYTNPVLNGFSLNPVADLRTAETHAERAIALGPELPATHAAHAAVMRQQRRFEEALVSYRRGVELDATQHASRANAGQMLVYLGRPEEGEALVRASLALAPPTHGFRLTWLTYLALALAQQERWAEAAESLRASLDGQAFLPAPVRLALLSGLLDLAGEAEGARLAAQQATAQNAELRLSWFRANPFSEHPAFAARQTVLLAAMARAGFPE